MLRKDVTVIHRMWVLAIDMQLTSLVVGLEDATSPRCRNRMYSCSPGFIILRRMCGMDQGKKAKRCVPGTYWIINLSASNRPMATIVRSAKCTMRWRNASNEKRDSNLAEGGRRREASSNGGATSDGIDPFTILRGTRRLGISNDAHDTPGLTLWKDQFPLGKDLGQSGLPFVIVMNDRFDELMNASGSSFTRFGVPDFDVKLNPGVNAGPSGKLGWRKKKCQLDIHGMHLRVRVSYFHKNVGCIQVCDPLGKTFMKPEFYIRIPDTDIAFRTATIGVESPNDLHVSHFSSDLLCNILREEHQPRS